MSVSGKLPHVFSGEDDLQVILSLPLAFLRLIASGVFTYEIDWRDDDWEPDEPTSDQLAIIEGALTAVTIAADGVSLDCDVMQTITQPNYTLVNNVSYVQDGRIFIINHTMLPSAASGAKALYLRLNVTHSTANQIIQGNKKSGDAIIYAIATTASITHRLDMILPMDEDGAELRSLAANGVSVTLGAFLVGWWK